MLIATAMAFGVMFVLKEIQFRICNDIEDPDSVVDDPGREPIRVADRRDFFANYLKSFFYVVVGFAILYAGIAASSNDAARALRDNGTGTYPAWDALWFSIQGITLNSNPEHLIVLMLLMSAQLVVFLTISAFVILTVFRMRAHA